MEVMEEIINTANNGKGDTHDGHTEDSDVDSDGDESDPLDFDRVNENSDSDQTEIYFALSDDDDDDGSSFIPDSDSGDDSDFEPGRAISRARTRRHDRSRGAYPGSNASVIRHWKKASPKAPNSEVKFEGKPGIQCSTENFKPVDYLELFFDEDFMSYIILQTNLYAQTFRRNNPDLSAHSRARAWTPVSHEEMKKFLSIVLLMGLVKLPSIHLYWTKKCLYKIQVFGSIMTRNRFQAILRFLNFHDHSNMPARSDPGYDRLFKIRPVIDHLHKRFQAVYIPRQAVCVNESLLLWKGQLLFKQCSSVPRAKSGIKVYLCCEADNGLKGSGGYCYRLKVYPGTGDLEKEIVPVIPTDTQHLSTSEKMVVFLVAPLLDKGYSVYTDSCYTSPQLFSYLLEKKTLACGAVKANRGLPVQLLATKLVPGASAAVCGDGKMVATKYHSTKVVYYLSTAHGHAERVVTDKQHKDIKRRPRVLDKYNQNIAGANKQHQLLQSYDCTRKSMKWTKKLFFHFLQMSACNAYILACKDGYKDRFLPFLESVILSWSYSKVQPHVDNTADYDDCVRLHERHFSFPVPPTAKKALPQRTCRVCRKKLGQRKDTRYYCPFCPSKPGLCYPKCFMEYHTKFIYWQ